MVASDGRDTPAEAVLEGVTPIGTLGGTYNRQSRPGTLDEAVQTSNEFLNTRGLVALSYDLRVIPLAVI